MKIMHIIIGLGDGGAERMMKRLILHMPNHFHIIVSLTDLGGLGRDLVNRGYSVHALNAKSYTIFFFVIKLWRLIRKNRPDVIQTWMYHADLLGGCIGRLAGIKNIIWNIRNTEIPQKTISITSLVLHLCALFSRVIPKLIISCSNAGLKSHILLGYDFSRMVVIPNGYDTNEFSPPSKSKTDIRELYDLPTDAFLVGFVGRFDPLKGVDNFVKAASIMTEQSRVHTVFLMVGKNLDSNNTHLRSIILSNGGEAEFILMGECKEIAQIMYVLDVFCLASKAEGFPNVVAESMLMQIPCIVTDVGDAAIIVGNTGSVVPPGNPFALANELLKFQSMSPVDLRDKGCAARNRIIENFAIERIVRCYEDVYK